MKIRLEWQKCRKQIEMTSLKMLQLKNVVKSMTLWQRTDSLKSKIVVRHLFRLVKLPYIGIMNTILDK